MGALVALPPGREIADGFDRLSAIFESKNNPRHSVQWYHHPKTRLPRGFSDPPHTQNSMPESREESDTPSRRLRCLPDLAIDDPANLCTLVPPGSAVPDPKIRKNGKEFP